MLEYKIIAIIMEILQNKKLLNGILVAFAFFSLNLLFQFYPLVFALAIAVILIIIGYYIAQLAMVLQLILLFPAVAYHSSGMAWIYLLFTAGVLVIVVRDYVNKSEYAERTWRMAAIIQMLVGSAFMPFPLSLLIFPLFALSAHYLSSKRAWLALGIALLLIMLISSMGNDSNIVNVTGNNIKFDQITFDKTAVGYSTVMKEMPIALSNMIKNIEINKILGTFAGNLSKLFMNGHIIILFIWVIPLWLISFIPGHIRLKYEETLTTILIFVIPIAMIMIENGINFHSFISCGIAGAIVFGLESLGIPVSREEQVKLKDREKKFMQFGAKELTLAKGIKSLDDVGNYDDVKEELKESVLTPLLNKELIAAYGIKPTKGILLFGPPGTGKTFIMTALAKEIDYGFFYVNSSSLTSGEFGRTGKNIQELFKVARKNQPAILFFDEIDAIGKQRGTGGDEASRMLTTLLQEMDGFKEDDKIIVVSATNKPEVIDPALMRPGRIDKIIYMAPPEEDGREAIFKIHAKKMHVKDIDYKKLAKMTPNFTGADIKMICEEVNRMIAKKAIKKNKFVNISTDDFVCLIKNIKPSVSERELRRYESYKEIFERRTMKANAKPKEIIKMPKINDGIDKAYTAKNNMLLFGPEGNGKSIAVKHYAENKGLTIKILDCMNDKITSVDLKNSTEDILLIERIENLPPKLIKSFSKLIKDKRLFATSINPLAVHKKIINVFRMFILVGLPNQEIRRQLLRQYNIDNEIIVKALSGTTYLEIINFAQMFNEMKLKGRLKNINLEEEIHILLSKTRKISPEQVQEYKTFMEMIQS